LATSLAVAVAAECVLTTDDGDVTPLDISSSRISEHQQHQRASASLAASAGISSSSISSLIIRISISGHQHQQLLDASLLPTVFYDPSHH
jgi:hypothetical protein